MCFVAMFEAVLVLNAQSDLRSNRHIHDVFVSAQSFIAQIEGQLETKRGHLLADHDLGQILLAPKFKIARHFGRIALCIRDVI